MLKLFFIIILLMKLSETVFIQNLELINNFFSHQYMHKNTDNKEILVHFNFLVLSLK